MIAADTQLNTQAPTQETGTLPRIPDRERRRALGHDAPARPRPLPGDRGRGRGRADAAARRTSCASAAARRTTSCSTTRSVSRRHALLTVRGETTVILDDRSLNGIQVNGTRVSEAALKDGDTILLGHVTRRAYVERTANAARRGPSGTMSRPVGSKRSSSSICQKKRVNVRPARNSPTCGSIRSPPAEPHDQLRVAAAGQRRVHRAGERAAEARVDVRDAQAELAVAEHLDRSPARAAAAPRRPRGRARSAPGRRSPRP